MYLLIYQCVYIYIYIYALNKSNRRLDNVSRVLNEDSSSDISRLFALFSCFQLVTTAHTVTQMLNLLLVVTMMMMMMMMTVILMEKKHGLQLKTVKLEFTLYILQLLKLPFVLSQPLVPSLSVIPSLPLVLSLPLVPSLQLILS